jgi:DNA-binding transcriptional regulator GbsR (MarR family)
MSETAETVAGGLERDDDAVSRFIERFAAELTDAGMQRVFAALLASDSGALSSAELGDQLRISPAAVSGAIRYLSQVEMVTREREPGSRRDLYRLYSGLWYETFTRRDQVLVRWQKTLREGVETLGADTPAGARLAESVEFFEFLTEELQDLMARWQRYKAARDVRPAAE